MRLQISRRVNSRRKSRKDILEEEEGPEGGSGRFSLFSWCDTVGKRWWGFPSSLVAYQNSPSSILTISCCRSAGSTAFHSDELPVANGTHPRASPWRYH